MTSSGANSITFLKPTGIQAGDVLVALLQSDYCTVGHAGPSGWTLLTWREESSGSNPSSNDPPLTGGTDLTGYVFYKVAGASEPASYTWNTENRSSARFVGGTVMAFRGVSQTDPIFDFGVNGQTSGLEIRCPSVDAPAGGELLCIWIHDDPVDIVVPSGMVQVANYKLPSGGNDDAGATARQEISSAGPTGDRIATYPVDRGGDNDMGISVVLRPA